jgi:hypothetical protein
LPYPIHSSKRDRIVTVEQNLNNLSQTEETNLSDLHVGLNEFRTIMRAYTLRFSAQHPAHLSLPIKLKGYTIVPRTHELRNEM